MTNDPRPWVFGIVAGVVAGSMVVSILMGLACAWRLFTLGETCQSIGLRDYVLDLLAVVLVLANVKPPPDAPPPTLPDKTP